MMYWSMELYKNTGIMRDDGTQVFTPPCYSEAGAGPTSSLFSWPQLRLHHMPLGADGGPSQNLCYESV